MIIGFNAAAGAGFSAPARIGGQPGFDGMAPDGASPGFSGALAQAAAPAASASATKPGPQGEDAANEAAVTEGATVDTTMLGAAAVDSTAADGAAVDAAPMAPAPVDADTVPGDDAAATDRAAAQVAAQASPQVAAVETAAQRAATGSDLAAAMARAAVAPPASQSGVRPSNGDHAAAAAAAGATTANGGMLALPETLRPQAPVLVVRTTETAPLPISASDPAAALPAPATARAGSPAVPEWSPVKVDTAQAHWGRDLMAALAERVEMQVTQQIKQARIRLDPPELGRLQLTVRLDSDRLSVQLNASQPQVREMLALQLDRLRTDLVGQYGDRVDVTVGQEQRQQRQPGGEPERQGYGIAAGLDAMDAVEDTETTAPRGQGWVTALA